MGRTPPSQEVVQVTCGETERQHYRGKRGLCKVSVDLGAHICRGAWGALYLALLGFRVGCWVGQLEIPELVWNIWVVLGAWGP